MITLDLLNSAFASVEIATAAGQALSIDGSGYITANIATTDIDIRDLASSQDSVEIKTAAGQALTIDASGYLTVNQGTSPWVVSATDLDIRDLSGATDSVNISDGTNSLIVNADGTLDVVAIRGGYGSWKVTAASATTTESELVATPLTGRKTVEIQNLGANDVYLGPLTGIAVGTGMKLPKGSSWQVDLDSDSDIFAITSSGTADLRVIEYAV